MKKKLVEEENDVFNIHPPDSCFSHGCIVAKHTGQGAGGCGCIPIIGKKMQPDQYHKIVNAFWWYRKEIERLKKEVELLEKLTDSIGELI